MACTAAADGVPLVFRLSPARQRQQEMRRRSSCAVACWLQCAAVCVVLKCPVSSSCSCQRLCHWCVFVYESVCVCVCRWHTADVMGIGSSGPSGASAADIEGWSSTQVGGGRWAVGSVAGVGLRLGVESAT